MKQWLNHFSHFLASHEPEMLAKLYQWCNTNSGTSNLMGLERMHHLIQEAYVPLADKIESHQLPTTPTINHAGQTVDVLSGNLLFIRKRPHLKRRILLSGHMDTVYGENHAFQAIQNLTENKLNGPGVADMKGGLLVMLHALMAFEETPEAETLGWDVVINADEEIGSPASRLFFNNIAPQYHAAFVYEPSTTPEGVLAKNRKGSGKLTLIATGKSAHAGRAFEDGRNAICYLAEAIIAVHELNGQRKGVTINVGIISGGDALNVVPDKAIAKLDVRITQPEDEHWVREQLERIISHLKRPDYTLTLHGSFERPVKRVDTNTTRLFERLCYLGKMLDLNLDWQDSGGCCDGNNFAHHGLMVLDTLGVRGGAIHSTQEYIYADSIKERAALSALLFLDLAQGNLEALMKSQ
jgi:glutamate carboxypeptidase